MTNVVFPANLNPCRIQFRIKTYVVFDQLFFPFSNHERPIELLRSDRRREINKAIREESIRLRSKGFRSLIDVRSELKSELVKDHMKMNGVAQVIFSIAILRKTIR